MSNRRKALGLQSLFREAYPLAGRAADVRSASVIGRLRDAALDREDLRQEVLVKVWTALARFDPARSSLRTFIERVAATSIASIFRGTRAAKRTKPTDYEPRESVLLLVTVEFRVDLERILQKLGPRERKVAQLLVEYGPTQIARRMRISRPSVYRSISRIRAALREGGFQR